MYLLEELIKSTLEKHINYLMLRQPLLLHHPLSLILTIMLLMLVAKKLLLIDSDDSDQEEANAKRGNLKNSKNHMYSEATSSTNKTNH